MRDEWFIRGEVPMSKAEVRAVSISKLELRPDSILYDIGAGTGSVSIEASFSLPGGNVYAVEKLSAAVELITANREKFQADRVTIVSGTAPEALVNLPRPSHAFIGGSSNNMAKIIDVLTEKNPNIRIVINIIALESLARTLEELKTRGIEAEIVLVQAARAKKAGSYHLMQGQNPVYIISFGGEGQS